MGKVILIIMATINPAEKEAADRYVKAVNAMAVEAGGKPLYRFPIAEQFLGETKVQLAASVEFPNQAAFDAVFKSKAYDALVPDREKGFAYLNAYIARPESE